MSTKAPALVNIYPQSVARVSAETAQAFSLTEGDIVRVKTKTGSLALFVAIEKAATVRQSRSATTSKGKVRSGSPTAFLIRSQRPPAWTA